jgi:hypothetical protein
MTQAENNSSWIKESFLKVQEVFQKELELASVSIGHPTSKGDVAEDHWIKVFKQYLPKRYEINRGIVIDSLGGRSDQIDIVIFDKHYTPTLLDQNDHRYIPIEAVYAVFEAKPHIDKAYLEYAGKKAASVRKLKPTSKPIPHAGGVYPCKPCIPIISGIVAAKANWADGLGASFKENLPGVLEERLDCGCALQHGAFDNFDDRLKIMSCQGALIYFLLRLLGKLQSLGTVPAIDWAAYAEILKDKTNDL